MFRHIPLETSIVNDHVYYINHALSFKKLRKINI